MFDRLHVPDLARVRQQGPRVDERALTVSARVFEALRSSYGVLFTNKFANGVPYETMVDGKKVTLDAGVIEAQRTWANALAAFDLAVIAAAIDRCARVYADYPPNLPQFLSLCRAARPREIYVAPRIAAPTPDNSAAARRIREQIARIRAQRAGEVAADKRTTALGLLKAAIANAAATAGGDEVAELRRLDRILPEVAA